MKNISTHTIILASFFFVYLAAADKAIAQENQFKDVTKRIMPATVFVTALDARGKPLAEGRGFFVSEQGEVITNYHLLKDAESVSVKSHDGRTFKITSVIAEHMSTDLILLQADTGENKVQFLYMNKAFPGVGEKIVVIGNTNGLENKWQEGIVSAVRNEPGYGTIIQVTAPVAPEASGSAVVNMKGEVIGVASVQIQDGQNLTFVAPADKIVELKEKKQAAAAGKQKGMGKKVDAVYAAARFYYFKEDYEKALPLFKQYLTSNQDSYDAWCSLCFCYLNTGLYKEAVEASRQAVRIKPDDATAHGALGLAYFNLDQYQEAIEASKEAVRLKPDYADAYCLLGLIYGNLNRYQEAIEAYKQALRIKPDDADTLNNLGNEYSRLGQYQESMQAYKQLTLLKPDDAAAYGALGLAYLKLDRYQEAIEASRQAVSLKPDDPVPHCTLGAAYVKLGRYQEAIEASRQAVSLKSNYAEALVNLGAAYAKLGRHPEAIQAYNKAITVNPNYVEALLNVGVSYSNVSQYLEAIETYRQVIRLQPKNTVAHYNLGVAYLLIKDRNSALIEHKKLKELDPKMANELFSLIYK